MKVLVPTMRSTTVSPHIKKYLSIASLSLQLLQIGSASDASMIPEMKEKSLEFHLTYKVMVFPVRVFTKICILLAANNFSTTTVD